MNLSAIDLFCGVGGLTAGLEKAGINVIAGIDVDSSCQFAYEKNNHTHFFCKDIKKVNGYSLKSLYPKNTIKVLVGCAPCQPFSKYSHRYHKNGEKDEKWGLLYSFSKIVREVEPEVVSMENVPSLVNETVFKDFVSSLKTMSYHVSYSIAYCPDYGVPQKRKRLVLLASKLGEIKLIPPVYSKGNYVTVRQAIGHLAPLSDGAIDPHDYLHQAGKLSKLNKRRIIQSVPGGTWRDWDKDLWLNCHKKKTGQTYPSVYGRMKWDEPSPTITTQFYGYGNGRFGHPEQNRAISLREGAILQSFPLDYIFTDAEHHLSKKQIATHIGNAVPVLLGKAIGKSILIHTRGLKDG